LRNWAGKAERLSFDVPTLPLFVRERLSTMAIVETLKILGCGGDQRNASTAKFEDLGNSASRLVV
jgi:hypothetical protein